MDLYSLPPQHDSSPFWIFIIFYYFIISGLVAAICEKRGHDLLRVFFASLFLSPIIAAILYAYPNTPKKAEKNDLQKPE